MSLPKNNLLSNIENPVFELVAAAAGKINQPAYIIGGWVRDFILERPSKDIDIVTVGSGIELARATADLSKEIKKVSTFKNFGTAMLRYADFEVEFVGARKESYSRNSRKPVVENGTLEDDQKRRDFTINALSISLKKDDYGQLHDPFNGWQDLQNEIIKTPLDPDVTFSDDPLRMLRAIRFAAQLNFQIHHETYAAISANKERIKILSRERIADELHKIMMCKKPSVGLHLLNETGLMDLLLPEITALKGVDEVEGQRHKDNFYHTLEVVDNISKNTDNLWLRYGALFHDIGKPRSKFFHPKIGWTFHGHEFLGSKMVPKIFRRLKFPLDDKMKFVKKMVFMSSRPVDLADKHVTDSGIRRLLFDAGDDVEDLMILCEADITTKNERRKKKYLENFKRVRQRLNEVEEKDHVRNFQPPVDGKEIMERYNLKPCKEIGELKNAVKEAILEGDINNNHDEALAFIDQLAAEKGLISKEQNATK